MRGKLGLLILLFLLISISISSAYLYLPSYFQSLDSRVRDFYFKFRGAEQVSDKIVIIDIDERSLKELGQWPWERSKVSRILHNLSENGAGIIGLDIVFSESDKTSPKKIAKEWGLNTNSLPDYDEVLAQTVSQTPTILGYVFDFDNVNDKEAPQIPAIFVEKSKKSEFLPQAKGVLPNLSIIQSAAYSSGYMNNIPDDSGIIRSVPMFISYDMEIYPSLALEMYRLSLGVQKISIIYDEAGISKIKIAKETILSDRFAKIYLNFRGTFKSYKYISAVDVYNNIVEREEIQGKYILIGTSAYGLMDLRSTPMDSVIAGVEIHANMIDNLIHKDMLYKPSWIELADLLSIVFTAFLIIFVYSRLSLGVLIPLFLSTFVGMFFLNYYILFHDYIILNSIFPMMSISLSFLGVLTVNYMFETRQKEMIKKSFSKKVSKQVMDDLLLHGNDTNLSAREELVTVYFSDIRSFTSISETLKPPQRITDFLNFYMNAVVLSIENNRGTIDKFIGDAIMAYWNAPLKVKNHADKAVETALNQIAKREELNETINSEYGFDVDYGIGINTGEVIVGEIGSEGRSDYTIIGDAVNLASRLEGLCKPYKVRLIISEFTKELLVDEYIIQLLDIVRVKGKREPVKIYEVQARGSVSQEKALELALYKKAHDLYLLKEFDKAKKIYNVLNSTYQKYLYELYVERCKYLEQENRDDFDGVFEFREE